MPHPKIWFILSEGQVTGPFDQEEVEVRISNLRDPQIWGRGHSEWMALSRWRHVLNEGSLLSAASEAPGLWKVRQEGQEQKTMTYADLISFLKAQKDLTLIDIAPHNSAKFKEVYAYSEVAEDLGVNRRTHVRVPLVGTLNCQLESGECSFRVISIGEGGLGINDAKDLTIGQVLKANLQSANLFVTIPCTVEVVYVGGDGYAGLSFVGLPSEYHSLIVEYVKKFATL